MPSTSWIKTAAFLLLMLFAGCERESIVDAGIDTTPPLPPAGLIVESAHDGFIFISWIKNRETDLRGYVVYRAEEADSGMFLRLDTLADFYYIDIQRSYDTLYWYRVTAIDRSGNESPPSQAVRAQSVNLDPPEPPAIVNVNGVHDASNQLIRLSWSDVDEADIRSFRVYRSSSVFSQSDPTLRIAETENLFFDDTGISELSSRYYYGITTIDHGNLESVLSPVGSDLISQRPLLISPAADGTTEGRPLFVWLAVPASREYRVSVSESEHSGELWSAIVANSGGDTISARYSGVGLASGSSWYWRVATITSDNGRVNGISDARRLIVRF